MTSSAERVRHEPYRVRSYEADAAGFASPLSICNYLQEAAGNHAFQLGVAIDQLAQRDLTWVLFRLSVRMDRYPRWRDDITVVTWPRGITRLYAFRDFELRDAAGGRLGAASSAWMLVDLKRRRPVRMPQEIGAFAVQDRPRALDIEVDERLAAPDRADAERLFRVRLSDLDMNRHVNNVNYVDWALETAPAEIRERHSLAELDVEFTAEAVMSDDIVAQAGMTGPMEFRHRIARRSDGLTLALARTLWR